MMQTIRQAFTILKQNPLLSTISILGTAFAITMIMAIVITWQTKYADLEPEVNRSRCLYFSAMHVQGKENKDWNNFGKPSAAFMKECIQPLPEVEACTAFSTADVALVSLTDGNNRLKVDAMSTDPVSYTHLTLPTNREVEICSQWLFPLLLPVSYLERRRLRDGRCC